MREDAAQGFCGINRRYFGWEEWTATEAQRHQQSPEDVRLAVPTEVVRDLLAALQATVTIAQPCRSTAAIAAGSTSPRGRHPNQLVASLPRSLDLNLTNPFGSALPNMATQTSTANSDVIWTQNYIEHWGEVATYGCCVLCEVHTLVHTAWHTTAGATGAATLAWWSISA